MTRIYENWLCYGAVASLGFAVVNSSYGQSSAPNSRSCRRTHDSSAGENFSGRARPEKGVSQAGEEVVGTPRTVRYTIGGPLPTYPGAGLSGAGTPGRVRPGATGAAGPGMGTAPAGGSGVPGGDAALGALATGCHGRLGRRSRRGARAEQFALHDRRPRAVLNASSPSLPTVPRALPAREADTGVKPFFRS